MQTERSIPTTSMQLINWGRGNLATAARVPEPSLCWFLLIIGAGLFRRTACSGHPNYLGACRLCNSRIRFRCVRSVAPRMHESTGAKLRRRHRPPQITVLRAVFVEGILLAPIAAGRSHFGASWDRPWIELESACVRRRLTRKV